LPGVGRRGSETRQPVAAGTCRDAGGAHRDDDPCEPVIARRRLNREFVLELQLVAGRRTAIRFRPQQGAIE